MMFDGRNGGTVELLDNVLVIRRKGVASFLTQGLKGEKRVPYSSITSVQFKEAGFTTGYIQFGLAGGLESRGGVWDATTDENTVLFTKEAANDFFRLREIVEDRSAAARAGGSASRPVQSSCVVEELTQLANLRDRGVLTDGEFAQQKALLLGNTVDKRSQASPEPAIRTSQSNATNLRSRINSGPPKPVEKPTNVFGRALGIGCLGLIGMFFLLSMIGSQVNGEIIKGQHWREFGSVNHGAIRLVAIDTDSAKDGSVYREAAKAMCNDGCFQVGYFLPGDGSPPLEISGQEWWDNGGWSKYRPLAVYTNTDGGEFTKWDCERAGFKDAPLTALCGDGAKEQYVAVLSIASREAWFKGCGLPQTDGRAVVQRFAERQPDELKSQLLAAYDEMHSRSLGGPDDPSACSYLRSEVEQKNLDGRKLLHAARRKS